MSRLIRRAILSTPRGDPAAETYITAAGITDETEKGLVRTLFAATTASRAALAVGGGGGILLEYGISSLASRTNLIRPSDVASVETLDDEGTPVSPTFTPHRGWTGGELGDGSFAGLIVSTPFPGGSAAIDDVTLGAVINAGGSSNGPLVQGPYSGGALTLSIGGGGTTFSGAINTVSTYSSSRAASHGAMSHTRTGSVSTRVYFNGSPLVTQPSASTSGGSFPPTQFIVGRSAARIGAVFWGRALDDAQMSELVAALAAYATAVGA